MQKTNENARVLLCAVNGSHAHTNLAIRCLRPRLEKEGFAVSLAEYQLRDRTGHILNSLYMADADIYGFSVYIWNVEVITELSRELKKLKPEAHIVWGGPEVSFETERFQNYDFLDCIMCGEGENTIGPVCRGLIDGTLKERVVHGEPGADTMKDEGILYREGEAQSASLFYYESSRGCPFSCAYCLSSVTEKTRMKSVDQVMRDLLEFEKFKGSCKVVKFVDRTFNADPKRANAIWTALLDEKYTLRYHFEICATLLNEESFEILSRFPKDKIQLEVGLQSTNEKTLGAVSRHLNPFTVIDASRRILNFHNMDVYLDLIAGLPYENLESFAKSFDDAYDACTRLQVGFLKLLPGTELRKHAKDYGYVSLEKAPYTVMQSNWMSFTDMMTVHSIDELLERYCDGHKFERTLTVLRPRIQSMFAFWKNLTEYIDANDGREIQKISQMEVYYLLMRYCDREGYMQRDELWPYLCADFEDCEHRKLRWYD